MLSNIERRQQIKEIKAVLVDLLDAACTGKELDMHCAKHFPGVSSEVLCSTNKLDKIVRLISHCSSQRGKMDELLKLIKEKHTRQYFRFSDRLSPLLPFPEIHVDEMKDAPFENVGLVQIQLILHERNNIQPSETNVYAWMLVDDEDFDIIGDDVIPIPWTNAQPDLVTFILRSHRSGHQRVRIEIYHETTYLGSVEKDIHVKTDCEPTEPIPITKTVTIYPDLEQPDLLIRFYRADVREGKTYYHYRVSSTLPGMHLTLVHMGGVSIEDPATVLQPVIEDLDRWARLETPDKSNLELRLKSLGVRLYNQLIAPTELGDLYWRLPRRCRTVQIISDVPGIPWELLRPKDADGRMDEAFARQFQLTRWHPQADTAAAYLRLEDMKLFVGQSIVLPLPGAELEAQELEALLGPHCSRVQPKELRAILESGNFGALHIISHGFAQSDNADESYVEVGDGQPKLAASDLAPYNWDDHHPLLFVNACNVGRAGPGLTGLGGWATIALTQARAGIQPGCATQYTHTLTLESFNAMTKVSIKINGR
jgi:hypothetical protein